MRNRMVDRERTRRRPGCQCRLHHVRQKAIKEGKKRKAQGGGGYGCWRREVRGSGIDRRSSGELSQRHGQGRDAALWKAALKGADSDLLGRGGACGRIGRAYSLHSPAPRPIKLPRYFWASARCPAPSSPAVGAFALRSLLLLGCCLLLPPGCWRTRSELHTALLRRTRWAYGAAQGRVSRRQPTLPTVQLSPAETSHLPPVGLRMVRGIARCQCVSPALLRSQRQLCGVGRAPLRCRPGRCSWPPLPPGYDCLRSSALLDLCRSRQMRGVGSQ